LLVLVFVTGLLIALMNPEVILGLPPGIGLIMIIPWILLILVLFMLTVGILAWIHRYWGMFWRVLYSLVVMCGLLFLGFLVYWNLLTPTI
jgi:hypothetical protein